MAISAEYRVVNKHGNTPGMSKSLEPDLNRISLGNAHVDISVWPRSGIISTHSVPHVTIQVLEDPKRRPTQLPDDRTDNLMDVHPGEHVLIDVTAGSYRAIHKKVLVAISKK